MLGKSQKSYLQANILFVDTGSELFFFFFFLGILEIFRLDMGQVRSNLLKKAFATSSMAFFPLAFHFTTFLLGHLQRPRLRQVSKIFYLYCVSNRFQTISVHVKWLQISDACWTQIKWVNLKLLVISWWVLEQFSAECWKTKTKPITCQLYHSASLKP